LQLVETQLELPAASEVDDQLPHRTKPRRRHSAPVASEPLQLVETHPGTEPQRTDGTNS